MEELLDTDRTVILRQAKAPSLQREKMVVLLSVLSSLIFTLIFACLKNPFNYTFSKIGNYFGYRGLYISWGILTGFCFQFAGLKLFKLTRYNKLYAYIALSLASFFLIVTTLIPSIQGKWPTLHILHKWTTFFYVMSMITAFHSFFIFLAQQRSNLIIILRNWQLIILSGSIASLLIQGQTGIFELWFFLGLGTLLIYLTCTLYEKEIRRTLNNEQDKE